MKMLSESTPKLSSATQSHHEAHTLHEIVIGYDLPLPTLNRHLSLDGSITSTLGNRSAGSYDMGKEVGWSESNVTSIYNDDFRPGEFVTAPNPNDVIFPISGMSQWPGNEFFMALVDDRRREFLTCGSRSKQAKIARELIQQVVVGISRQQDQPIARFLSRITNPNVIVGNPCPWVVMDETSVLVYLGKAFRAELDGVTRNKHDRQKKKKKKNKDDNIKINNSFDLVSRPGGQNQSSVLIECHEKDESDNAGLDEAEHDPLRDLKTLYHIPSDDGPNIQLLPTGQVCSSHTTSAQSYPYDSILPNQDGDSLYHVPHSRLALEPNNSDNEKDPKRSLSNVETDLSEKHQKRQYKRKKLSVPNATSEKDIVENSSASGPTANSDNSKLTSKAAAFANEGEIELPKGVTVRPSGKWVSENIQNSHMLVSWF
jgi:hypothetical protein